MTPEQPAKNLHPVVVRARRSWERRRFARRLLIAPAGVGVVVASAAYRLELFVLLGVVVVIYGVVQSLRAGFGLLVTVGTYRLALKEAQRAFGRQEQLTDAQKKELQASEVDALVARQRAQRDRMLALWRTSKRRVLWLLGTGMAAAASLIGAFELALAGSVLLDYGIFLLLASICIWSAVVIMTWKLVGSVQEAGDELAERRQLAREQRLLTRELQGDHLAGGLSVSTNEDESLRGGLTQDTSRGGLSQAD
jgi:hypothetical protein